MKQFPLFGEEVARAMKALRISGRALAAEMAVREQTVSEWRAGSFRPEGDRLIKLADLLRVSPETLRRDDRRGVVEEPKSHYVSDPVAELVRRGQAEQAAWVLEFAAQLLEAGAKRLRQGVRDQAFTKEIAAIDEVSLTPTAPAGEMPAKAKKSSAR